MRKSILTSTLIACNISLLIGQIDHQWFIRDGYGKDGFVSQPLTFNNYSNSITGNGFYVEGFYMPQTLVGKNDIFIIYTDATFYNSRGTSPHPFLTIPSVLPTPRDNFNFLGAPGKGIGYMYSTRNYEGDDPPGSIKVHNGNNPSLDTVPFLITNPHILSATHNVVRGRDITVIIDLDELRSTSPSNDSSGQIVYPPWYLRLDRLKHCSGNIVAFDSCFSLFPVFKDNVNNQFYGGFPRGAYAKSPRDPRVLINLNSPSPFLYLNLRSTPSIDTCFPGAYHCVGTSPNYKYEAAFVLEDSQGKPHPQSPLLEKLMDSFDPNFVRVESLCRDKDRGLIIQYHIEFENNGTLPVNNVRVHIEFPLTIDPKCVELVDWNIGGSKTSKDSDRQNTKYNFYFNQVNLDSCSAGSPTPGCIGFLKLKVKYPQSPGQHVSMTDTVSTSMSIKPLTTQVYFDQKRYDITTFIDKIEYEIAVKPQSTVLSMDYREWRPVDIESNCEMKCNTIKIWPWLVLLALAGIGILIFKFKIFGKK